MSGGLSPQEKLQLAATCSVRYPCAEETQESKTNALAFRESRFSASLCVQDWGKECPAGAAHRWSSLGVWKARLACCCQGGRSVRRAIVWSSMVVNSRYLCAESFFFGGPILLCWEMQRPIATETSISKLFDGQFGS